MRWIVAAFVASVSVGACAGQTGVVAVAISASPTSVSIELKYPPGADRDTYAALALMAAGERAADHCPRFGLGTRLVEQEPPAPALPNVTHFVCE